MSEKHHDEVGGVKVGHGDIPKFLYVVYIGLLLWAAYYFTLDSDTIDYVRKPQPKVAATFDDLQKMYNCSTCHPGSGPDFSQVPADFKSKEELIKYLEDPVAARPNSALAPVMKAYTDKFTDKDRQIIADELLK